MTQGESHTISADSIADDAVALVASWLETSTPDLSDLAGPVRRLAQLIEDPAGVAFTMQFVDQVVRPESDGSGAHQLRALLDGGELPQFLSVWDRMLLRVGGAVAPLLPGVVMPLARRRLRALVGHLITGAENTRLAVALAANRTSGFNVNVNLLGEAVLGESEALARLDATLQLLEREDVNYLSVKLSSVASQLNLWSYEATVQRISERLRLIYDQALRTTPPKFVNLDMEEYRDLDLTIEAFTRVLSEDRYRTLPAGIVLQAYLPDSYPALQALVEWATERNRAGGADIKIRLVKGANLAMERVEAEIHGWHQAPYASKIETDANYKRCVDWLLTPRRMVAVRLGIASHNLFDVAWARLLAESRQVDHRVEFEMLQGMAPEQAELVRRRAGSLLLYTPVVRSRDFDTAISYLFRRLEENASEANFIRHLFSMSVGSPEFRQEESKFRASLAARTSISSTPRRTQDRSVDAEPLPADAAFVNEPDTDPALSANRSWAARYVAMPFSGISEPPATDKSTVDRCVARAVQGSRTWQEIPVGRRRAILRAVGDELARRRGDLLNAMVHEASKTVGEADPEISEAIDFARWYGDRAVELEALSGVRFQPLGVVAVIPPWNFPVAIPAGGVLAALAAGNGVVFKPSKETPRCAEIIAQACWASGVPEEALQLLYTTDRDIGGHLVTHRDIDAVILTGSWETAERFLTWRPDLSLFAETSGKNALVVSPHADLDLAAGDLVRSAFGHSGQKCSAASLGILIGSVYTSERFLRQVVDATRSLHVGTPDDLATTFGPVIRKPGRDLHRALTTLEPGEEWLLEPTQVGRNETLWTPGIRYGVGSGTWFHETECFGPVLGLVYARDLPHAIEIQNSSAYGLTGGLHSLDLGEVEAWLDQVEVGNAYVNRHTTGAIVQRQPFGGWKRSVVGPGFKAGGPNYLYQLGTWHDSGPIAESSPIDAEPAEAVTTMSARLSESDRGALESAAHSDAWWWQREFGIGHDPTGIPYEANLFRYRARPNVVIRVEDDASDLATARSVAAALRAGATIEISSNRELSFLFGVVPVRVEDSASFEVGLTTKPPGRVRFVGTPHEETRKTARAAHWDLIDQPVLLQGRIELMWYLREQAISRTMHRFGNVVGEERSHGWKGAVGV